MVYDIAFIILKAQAKYLTVEGQKMMYPPNLQPTEKFLAFLKSQIFDN